MAYAYVLFDLDGTLLDTLEDLTDSVNQALRTFGYPPRTREEICAFVGNGVARLVALAVPKGTSAHDEAACLATFKAIYAQNCQNKTRPYEGICQLLTKLKTAGVGVAIVSNKLDEAVKVLAKTYFEGLVDVAVGERESQGIGKKPAPDTVFEAMRLLCASPADTVYVGDSEVDVLTAQNAGIPCISVTWGFRSQDVLLQAGAKTLANSVSQLETYLLP